MVLSQFGNGKKYLFNLFTNPHNMDKEHIAALITATNNQIAHIQYNPAPAELYDPIRYFMQLGGKRLRPVLCLLSYQLFKNDWENILKPAVALEIFHNFTLLHDDIMDKAPLRRGQPTVHEKWNQNVAILSGDVMLVIAYQQFEQLPPHLFKQTIAEFNKTAIEVCEGQQIDMNFESASTVYMEEYLNMIRLKTAVLLGLSCRLGGLFAEQTPQTQQMLADFGTNAGIAFQLKDDMLDIFGDPDKVGKQPGGDIIQNKKTFLLIKALELAEGSVKEELNYWLTHGQNNPEQKVRAVKQIYEHLQIETLAENAAQQYLQKALSSLNHIPSHNQQALENLKGFTKYLLNRAS